MSRPISLLALLCGVGIFVLLISLAQTDLTGVPADSSSSDLRQSVSHTSVLAKQQNDKRQLLAFIGVQTGFTISTEAKYNYKARRAALRATWFPDSQEGLDRLERDTNMLIRFIIGRTSNDTKEAELMTESNEHGGFLRLDLEVLPAIIWSLLSALLLITANHLCYYCCFCCSTSGTVDLQEQYNSLTNKTVAFLQLVTSIYEPQYIVKADDDVYLRVDRIPYAVKQWSTFQSDYIGCMKTGRIMTSPEWRWYEPQHAVLGGGEYFTHAWGSIYVLSGNAALRVAQMPTGSLRFFANEDVTLGSWMLAFNVRHFDDRRLCDAWCTSSSLAVYNIPECSGLCNPVEDLVHLHAQSDCVSPALTDGSVPLLPPIFRFNQ
ncbi:TPA: hypothetical protein ACH3X1_007222 [Trebouxia sp. C0004]